MGVTSVGQQLSVARFPPLSAAQFTRKDAPRPLRRFVTRSPRSPSKTGAGQHTEGSAPEVPDRVTRVTGARRTENEEPEETCHNVPSHYCQSSPVENVVHQCKKVSDGPKKCEKVPVQKCSTVSSQQCRQVCA